MNKKAIGVLILLVAALFLALYSYYSATQSANSGIKIFSVPQASIFLNDNLVGKTPYEAKHPSGEYVVKLIPSESTTQSASWQGKVILSPSLLTYIRRDLGVSELTSAGEIVMLEKIPGNEAQIAVFSTPQTATVLIDGQERGVTPTTIREVQAGEHEVAVTATGFIGRTIRVQATAGYRLSVNFQLALGKTVESEQQKDETSETDKTKTTTEKKTKLIIKDTPTGFLRVRSQPSTSASESARVKPGETFEFIEEKNGWYKIVYEQGKEGWVSSRYVDVQ